MSNIILLTGSTGTVGKEVIRSLVEKLEEDKSRSTKTTIRLLVRDVEKAKDLFSSLSKSPLTEFEYYRGDITHLQSSEDTDDTVTRAFSGINRLFLSLIASPNLSQQEISLTRLAFENSPSTLQQVIKLSGLGADLNHDLNSVFRWHGEAERDLNHYLADKKQIAYIILRPNLFLQNFLRDDIKSIRDNNVFYRPGTPDDKDYRVSHIDVRDIGDATAALLTGDALKHAGRTFNLTGPQPLTYNALADIVSNELGRKVNVIQVDDYKFFNSILSAGMPEVVGWIFVKLFQYYKLNGTTAIAHGDFQILTGKPPRSARQFFQDFKHLFQSEGSKY